LSRRLGTASAPPTPAEQSLERVFRQDPTPAIERRGARVLRWVHELQLDATTYARLLSSKGGEYASETAFDFVEQHLERLAPRDPLERMLAIQLLWQHVRIATLCVRETQTGDPKEAAAIRAGIEQAMNTFRRQARTLRELQAPRPTNFIRGGQVNVGDGQVISNTQINEAPNAENELGMDHDGEAGVPALSGGSSEPRSVDTPRQAVDAVHRAQNGGRQGRLKQERR
jgi:hypothetical protein